MSAGIYHTLSSIARLQIDTFTNTGNGTVMDFSNDIPYSKFSLQVSATGAVTTWTVLLEGSIDGVTYTTISTHTQLLGTGITIFPGTNSTPCYYVRARCSVLILGLGTNIISRILAVP